MLTVPFKIYTSFKTFKDLRLIWSAKTLGDFPISGVPSPPTHLDIHRHGVSFLQFLIDIQKYIFDTVTPRTVIVKKEVLLQPKKVS